MKTHCKRPSILVALLVHTAANIGCKQSEMTCLSTLVQYQDVEHGIIVVTEKSSVLCRL